MVERRRWQGVRERARGVGLVVLLGLAVCVIGLAIAALLTWAMT